MEYTSEQVEDIKSREKKGLEALKELGLTPAAALTKINVENDSFVDKVIPYLQDTKYASKKEEDKPVAKAEEPVEAERA